MIRVQEGNDLFVRLIDGEDLVRSLSGLAVDSGVLLAGIGMVRKARFGFWNGTAYEEHRVEDPAELLSMQGNFATSADGRVLHCHAVVAARDGTVLGGHLLEATVHNTAEVSIRVLAQIRLERRPESTGLLGLYPRL